METKIKTQLDNSLFNCILLDFRYRSYCRCCNAHPVSCVDIRPPTWTQHYRIIQSSSNENDLVYIPFAGSGSEILSCINNKRNWLATELNKEYIDDIIIPRISGIE